MGTPIRRACTATLSVIHRGSLDPGPAAFEAGLAEQAGGDRLQNPLHRDVALDCPEDAGVGNVECAGDEATGHHEYRRVRSAHRYRRHGQCLVMGLLTSTNEPTRDAPRRRLLLRRNRPVERLAPRSREWLTHNGFAPPADRAGLETDEPSAGDKAGSEPERGRLATRREPEAGR
jgi:hypothetical protein